MTENTESPLIVTRGLSDSGKKLAYLPVTPDDAILVLTKENTEGTRYGVELYMPEHEDGLMLPFEEVMAALATFIEKDANIDIIMEHFKARLKEAEGANNNGEVESD